MNIRAKIGDLADRAVLCWLATVDADGKPNVSPKEIFALSESGDFLIADIASPGSVKNIEKSPDVCVSLIDIFEQKGAKLKGHARLVPAADPSFDAIAAPLIESAGSDFPIRHAIVVKIDQVVPIIAPSYNLRPDLSEQDRRRSVYDTYGVVPVRTPYGVVPVRTPSESEG